MNATTERLIERAERAAERVRAAYARQRVQRARRGDVSYTRDPRRVPSYRT